MSDGAAIAVPAGLRGWRRFPLDGALLLFDRHSGGNARCEGAETAHLRQRAPRVVQLGITNHCNLACHFCSRALDATSAWTADEAFALLSGLADEGVLEVAFGGGEPWVFRGLDELLLRLWDQTPLAASVTSNGLLLDRARLRRLRGRYGQIRLSLYDDNRWRATVALLADEGARFGINYLVTPARLPTLPAVVLELAALGCRDVLLLSYNGADAALHLSAAEAAELAGQVRLLHRALGVRCVLKLDVCWGGRMDAVPRLFARGDCGAGREFVVVTSDRKVMPCSFHQAAVPVRDAGEVMAVWRGQADLLATPSTLPGCARVPGFGLARRLPMAEG